MRDCGDPVCGMVNHGVRRESYPKPWRAAFHLAWFVVAADDSIVAGPFDSAQQAWGCIDAWKAGE